MMTERRFARLVAAHGADPARWPEARRHAGLDWVARHPAATAELAAARRLDALLDLATPPPVTDAAARALADRIMATLDARAADMPAGMPVPATMASSRLPRGVITTVVAVAAVALVGLGLLLGRSVSLSQTTTAEAEQMLMLGGPTLTAGFSS